MSILSTARVVSLRQFGRGSTFVIGALACACFGSTPESKVRGQEPAAAEEEERFSGPQVGEPLPKSDVRDAFARDEEKFEIPPDEGRGVHAIIFVHERTRPSVGLTRSIAEGIARFPEPRPQLTVVFLTDDPTSVAQWANVARNALPQGVRLGISTDGPEGPGAWGLNRSVMMTVLVAKDGTVTDNFALVQPGVAVDSPKILQAVARAADVPWDQVRPTEAPMERPARGGAAAGVDDETFRALMRPLLDREADQETIERIAREIEAKCADNPALRARLADVAKRIVTAGVVENYGNEHAQAALKRWAESLMPLADDRR